MMNSEKEHLIEDFGADIPKMLDAWRAFKDIDMVHRCAQAYAEASAKRPLEWNLAWQRDMQGAWNAIAAGWSVPATARAVHAASEQLCSNAAWSKLGPQWSVPLRTAARDALLLSSTIVAYGDLTHPACQHAAARWDAWKNDLFVLGDHKGALLTLAFVDQTGS